jgi:prevent-host-death family protein
MNQNFLDLRRVDFIPLSEAKARLSEFVRSVSRDRKRVALTTNGRPSAVILSYSDFLDLLNLLQPQPGAEGKTIDFDDWEKGRAQREMVRDSLLKQFDPSKLSRKGQKYYKKRTVESLGETNLSKTR